MEMQSLEACLMTDLRVSLSTFHTIVTVVYSVLTSAVVLLITVLINGDDASISRSFF